MLVAVFCALFIVGASDIEEIVITPTRLPAAPGSVPFSTTVLDSSSIQGGRPTLSLGDVLAQVPGVFVVSRYNFAQDTRLSIRGFGARSAFGIRGLRLFLDGIPLTLPDGQSQVDSLDLASVGRIEILRGPAGSLYGNAAGGVVWLQSQRPSRATEVDVTQLVGAFGLSKTSVAAQGRVGKSEGGVFVSHTDFVGYRDRSKTRQTVAQGRLRVALTPNWSWSTHVHYVRAPQAQDPGALTRDALDQTPTRAAPNNVAFRTGEDLTQLQVGARLVGDPFKNHRLELVAHAGVRTFEGRIPFRLISFNRDFFGALGIYRWQATWGPVMSTLAAGIEWEGQQDDRRNEGNEGGNPDGNVLLQQDERASGLGIFVQEQLTFGDAFTVLGSLRYDRVDFELKDRVWVDGDASGERAFDQATGRGGLVWRPRVGLEVFANVSQSFETPTLTELVSGAPQGAGLNPTLRPQRALAVEAGGRWGDESLRLEATGFWIDLQDELVPRENAENRVIFENAGTSHRVGLEALARVTPIEGWDILAGYTWLRAEFQDGPRANKRLPGLPEHRVFTRMQGSYRFLRAAVEVEWVDRIFADDANAFQSDAYALGELRLGVVTGLSNGLRGRLTLGVRNIFDVRYPDNIRINGFGERFFEPGPPLHAYLSVAVGYGAVD